MEIRTFQFEGWLREAWQSARTLARSPGSTVPVVALLALGIGGSTAVFSVYDALFLNALPVEEPEGLATISRYWSVPNFEDFRRMQTSFSGIFAAGVLQGTVALEGGEQLDAPKGILISGNYFQVLGLRPIIGRLFTEEDDRIGNPQPAIVISNGFWRRQFGGRPDILGTRVYLSGSPFTIIGVTPAGFTGDTPGRITDFWAPLNTQPLAMPQGDRRRNRGFNWVAMMGRLKRDVTLHQAQAEAQVIFERLVGQPAGASRPTRRPTIEVESGMYGFPLFRRSVAVQFRILSSAAFLVFLIICLNTATLILVRGTARRREIALRLALGCGRARLVRQLFSEGLLLSAAAGVLAILLAPLLAQSLLLLQPAGLHLNLSPNRNSIVFGASLVVLMATACSLVPALTASRVAIEPALRSASRNSTASGPRRRGTHWMIAFQASLSVVLVTTGFLFTRSLMNLRAVGSGFDREHIISVTTDPRTAGYRDDETQARLGRELVEKLSAVPGVRSASVALCAVLMGCSRMAEIETEAGPAGETSIWLNSVSPNYFETTGIPMLAGRAFSPTDRLGAPRVAIVSEALAHFYFPGQQAIGKRFTPVFSSGERGDAIEIIGVVRDVKFVNPRDAPIRMAFLSYEQFPGPFSYIQVRTAGSPRSLLGPVRRAILEVDPKLYLRGPETLGDVLSLLLSRETVLSRASSVFAAIALLLACVGIYAVVSYVVTSGRNEIGIRLALGAEPGVVLREVIGHAVKTVIPGILVGVAGAWAAGRFVESLLFGVSGHDPATYAAVVTVLIVTTIAAAYFPARGASRIDPVEALRCE